MVVQDRFFAQINVPESLPAQCMKKGEFCCSNSSGEKRLKAENTHTRERCLEVLLAPYEAEALVAFTMHIAQGV